MQHLRKVPPHPAFSHLLPHGEGISPDQEESILIAQEYSCSTGMILFRKRPCEKRNYVTI